MSEQDEHAGLDEHAAVDSQAGLDDRPAVTLTGQRNVDEALQGLQDLDDIETSEHVSRYEQIHHRLQEALAEAGRDAADPGGIPTG